MYAGAKTPKAPFENSMESLTTIMALVSDPKGASARMEELKKATKEHDRAKKEAESAQHGLVHAQKLHSKRQGELDAREAEITKREETHGREQASAVANAARVAAEQEKLAAELKVAQAKLAEDVGNFSRYREREITAIQAKASQATKLHGAADEDRALAKQEREAIQAQRAALAKFHGEMVERLKSL